MCCFIFMITYCMEAFAYCQGGKEKSLLEDFSDCADGSDAGFGNFLQTAKIKK